MILKIYLFRHGQTTYNKKHIFTGWKDSELTVLGKKQARIIAKKLKSKEIDVAFQTRLSRSKDTLREVLKFHPECKIIIEDDRMIERSYGKLQGHSHQSILDKYGEEKLKKIRRDYTFKVEKGESIKMVETRVLSFIKDLLAFIKREKVNVAISAHGNSMRPFRRYFEKSKRTEMMSWEMPYDDYFEYSVKV